ncbi:hypothetical protein [Salipiger profundus]|uniref:hypothetical protein n=1 Tax=Salipiger profundus TaxID=1229727 RepID=UPI001E62D344|nr:hypothetical protein [Salipiger profundus]
MADVRAETVPAPTLKGAVVEQGRERVAVGLSRQRMRLPDFTGELFLEREKVVPLHERVAEQTCRTFRPDGSRGVRGGGKSQSKGAAKIAGTVLDPASHEGLLRSVHYQKRIAAGRVGGEVDKLKGLPPQPGVGIADHDAGFAGLGKRQKQCRMQILRAHRVERV